MIALTTIFQKYLREYAWKILSGNLPKWVWHTPIMGEACSDLGIKGHAFYFHFGFPGSSPLIGETQTRQYDHFFPFAYTF